MKITSDETRMLEIEFGVFVHIRGTAIVCDLLPDCDEPLEHPELARLSGKRVLILELVE